MGKLKSDFRDLKEVWTVIKENKILSSIIVMFFILLFFLPKVQATTISPENFFGRNCLLTGNETILWSGCEVTLTQVRLTPVDSNFNDINLDNVTYSYPSRVPVYSGRERTLVSNNILELNRGRVEISLNPLIREYQIFDNPIIIFSESNYNSTDVNVTQENQFAHINISDPNLILYMPFDVEEDSSNITYDYTNQSNDGTLNNTPTWTDSGYIGGAYNFSGSSSADSIIVSNYTPFNGINEITYSVWINPSVGGGFRGIITSRGSTFNAVDFSSSLGLVNTYVNTQPSQIENAYTLGNWTHIVATWRNSAAGGDGIVRIYSNGVEGSYTVIGGTNSSLSIDDVYKIGWDDLSAGRTFTGMIDEVMIFNRSLSPTEILELYNSTYDRFYPTGEMLFENLDFGSNNTVNISIPLAQQLNGSDIQFKINDGSYVSLNSTGDYDGYQIFGDLQNANLTLKLTSNDYGFYSSLVVGNITLNDYDGGDINPPNINLISPTDMFESSSLSVTFSALVSDNIELDYVQLYGNFSGSWDLVNSNFSGINNTFYNFTESLTNGYYVWGYFANDTSGNFVFSQNRTLTVDLSPTPINGTFFSTYNDLPIPPSFWSYWS